MATTRRVLVDYGGPNVAKEMHVGHLRASIIGEAIKRLYRFRGDTVLGDAHFGDWGFQMGLLISAVLDADPTLAELVARYEAAPGDATEAPLLARVSETVSLEDLDRIYPAASERSKTDPAYRDRARKATAELQAGRARLPAAMGAFRHRHPRGAAARLPRARRRLRRLEGRERRQRPDRADGGGVARQGPALARPGRRDHPRGPQGDKRELPPLLVVSSEGSAMYGTTDLATILDRKRYFDPEAVL